MTKTIRNALLSFIMIVIALFSQVTVYAFESTDAPYAGSGTSTDPYRYLILGNEPGVKSTWKSLVDLRYPFLQEEYFGAQREQPLVKVLEVHEGDQQNGKLLYSWKFNGNDVLPDLQPDNLPESGGQLAYYSERRRPQPLKVTFDKNEAYAAGLPTINESEAMFLTFECNTDIIIGRATMTFFVAEHFADGDKVSVYYYGGNTGSHHGTAEPLVHDYEPYFVQKGVVVQNGYLSFDIKHGGSYVLMKENAPVEKDSAVPLTEIKVDGESDAYKGDGSTGNPFVFIAEPVSKVTWKRLAQVKERGWNEIYEIREGNAKSGKLLYAWFFKANEILGQPEGPYQLNINFSPQYDYDLKSLPDIDYNMDNALWLTFQHNRPYPGKTSVTIDVSSKFDDNDTLYLYYYGGGDGDIIHSGTVAVVENPETELKLTHEKIKVTDGYITLEMKRGGNYYLTDKYAAIAPEDYTGYITEGVIGEVFTNPIIAKGIATKLGRKTTDSFTQDDLDMIQELSFYQCGLKDVSDLAKVKFTGLKSLVLDDNALSAIPDFKGMPKLKTLLLNDNVLESIPDLSSLTKLEVVNLANNRITAKPSFKQAKLAYVELNGNPINTGSSVQTVIVIVAILLAALAIAGVTIVRLRKRGRKHEAL